jgi:diacylglycerol O-acyltransferase
MPDAVTDRLNSTDEMLCSASSNLGSSRIVQVLWRFSSEVPSSALQDEWNRLNQSRLSRQAAPSRIPGGRRKWVSANNEELLHEYSETLTDENMMDWIDSQVRAPLPLGSGALWRLAAVPCRGGSLLSLTVPHFRCDGLGIFAALGSRESRSAHRPLAASLIGSDLGDALVQTTQAIAASPRWVVRFLANRQERTRFRAALRSRSEPAAAGSEPRFFVSAIFDLDAALWEEKARAHGGTVNSLFVEIVANLIRARIPLGDRTAIDVGIPKSLRRSDTDGRANALVVVPLSVPAGPPQHKDLRQTRQDTKTVLQDLDERSLTLVPEPVWHLLPSRYASRLKAPGAQQTDVVASNFGCVPDAVVRFAGQAADSVALRTMNVPGLVPEKARLRASLCMLQVGDRVTVTATGMPDQFGNAESLRHIVADEFAAWGLPSEQWCCG